ncbi:MAG: H-NS histone family protein [Burkholderiales bacterium]|nr:H-NS histone family protein [Burkholderiales bacterium]
MSNLIDIQSQIEKLQKQANEIKTREFDKTVQDILAKMQAFGITVKDLQAPKGRGAKGKAKAAKTSAAPKVATGKKKSISPVLAKYCGPNGEKWSGRGLMPKWMSALVAQGKIKEDFAIQA